MDKENIASWVVGIIALTLLLGSCLVQIDVRNECEQKNGIVVKSQFDWPTCIEEGEH